MRSILSWIFVGATAIAVAVPPAVAHPGRTNAAGYHTCRTNCAKWGLKNGEYHRHGPSRSFGTSRPPSVPPPTPAPPPTPEARSGKSIVLPERGGSKPPAPRCILKVLVVVDGNSFVARQAEILYLVKLSGVEAPELEQPYGVQARDALATQIGGREIVIWPAQVDEWMIHARVKLTDGTDVAEKMLSNGAVWAGRSAPELWRRFEAHAKARSVGIWAEPNPEQPWEYRKRRRQTE